MKITNTDFALVPPIGRLAPSPTGALHLGNARSFLLAWLSIRSRNGTLLLRVEDLDHPKVKPQFTQQMLDDLRWLGLDWDGEPIIQSERKAHYQKALDTLREKGLVYPCVCSRKDVESAASAPQEPGDELYYPGTCRKCFASYDDALNSMALTDPRWQSLAIAGSRMPSSAIESPLSRLPAWRFRAPDRATAFTDLMRGPQRENVSATVGDFPIARSPDGAGYMLAVVVDDAAMGITEVLRGDDLLSATHRQLLLYEALNLPPPVFAHVPLVVAEDGRRLAKRHGDTRIATLRQQGHSPESIVGLLAYWCGWVDFGTRVHPAELLQKFSLQTLSPNPAVLDGNVKKWLGIM